jgi:purine-binding chemotaxis protein CheW
VSGRPPAPARAPEDARRVLEERARLLARPPQQDADAGDRLELLVFSLGGERYGVDASRVVAVLAPVPATPLPGTRAGLVGVVNHRGEVLAVVDLRGLLGAAPAVEAASEGRIVVVDAGGAALGFRADEVIGLVRAEASGPAPQPARPERGLPGWIRGVTGGMVSIVDLEALARDPRVRVEEG